ncbi:MAG: hypothetical protein IKD37_09025 [Clostridia bacterium]|nr:hypothetical protein [Clostridia bacterium]
MKYCDNCRLAVRTNRQTCPLCQAQLRGEGESAFPEIKSVYNQFILFFKLLLALTIAGAVASVAINLMIPESGLWCHYVLFGGLCFWVLLITAIRRRTSIPRGILNQVFWICIFSGIWDALTVWHGWSIDFVIPCTCIIAIVALGVLGKVLRLPTGDYLACILVDAVFGIVPLVFYLTGLSQFVYLSLSCVAVSLIAAAFIFIFHGKQIRSDLARRFHV